MTNNRYALITVDTEALPKRAPCNHVKRLIWGEHDNGTAGIREMCAIGNEFGAKHVFFVDVCGAYAYKDEVAEVIQWLHIQGQDVQLHAHPEYLPKEFWGEHQFAFKPQFMNQYADDKDEFVISHFSTIMQSITGEKIRAFRAGSFRWNAGTIRALEKAGIPLSFNNSMLAMHNEQCIYSIPSNAVFSWSNGVTEVPVTEKNILPRIEKDWWVRLQYPQSKFYRYRPWWSSFIPYSANRRAPLLVFLLHSWSLLHWDESGYGVYKDDVRMEGYRKLLKNIAKDYDIITTAELLDLVENGKIRPTHIEDLSRAELNAPRGKC